MSRFLTVCHVPMCFFSKYSCIFVLYNHQTIFILIKGISDFLAVRKLKVVFWEEFIAVLYQSKEIPSVMIHRVLFQPKAIKFLYINSEVISIIFFHCDMNALTLKLDMGISVKIMKFHRKTFAFGYSLWILGFAPLKIMKFSDERQKFYNILKHFVHKNIMPYFMYIQNLRVCFLNRYSFNLFYYRKKQLS